MLCWSVGFGCTGPICRRRLENWECGMEEKSGSEASALTAMRGVSIRFYVSVHPYVPERGWEAGRGTWRGGKELKGRTYSCPELRSRLYADAPVGHDFRRLGDELVACWWLIGVGRCGLGICARRLGRLLRRFWRMRRPLCTREAVLHKDQRYKSKEDRRREWLRW